MEIRVNGQPEKHNSLPSVIRKKAAATSRKDFNPEEGKNVFEWVLYRAAVARHLKRLEKDAFEKAAAESKKLDSAEVEN